MFVQKMKRLFTVCVLAIVCAVFFAGLSPTGSAHAASVVSPHRLGCGTPGWVYNNITDWGSDFVGVTPAYRSYNGTPSNATGTFTATTTATVTLTASIGTTVNANAIVAGISATFSISVSASISTSIGHSISITIPSHEAGYAQYGVSRLHTTGHYYFWQSDCTIGTDYGTISVYSPWYPTWNTWLGA